MSTKLVSNPRKIRAQNDVRNSRKNERKKKWTSPARDEFIVEEKSQFSLPVISFDFLTDKLDSPVNIGKISACGPSCCGKTNVLFTILVHINGLR